MKKQILFFVSLFCSLGLYAQHPWAKRSLVGEVGLGSNYAWQTMIFSRSTPGLSAFGEVRYNFESLPFSIGVREQADLFQRKGRHEWQNMDYLSYRFLLVGDYHRWLTTKVIGFAGFGLGVAHVDNSENLYLGDTDSSFYIDDGPFSVFSFQPCIGIILSKRIRISVSYTYGDRANSFIGLHVGYII